MLEIEWSEKATAQYHDTLEYWIIHNKPNEYSLKIVNAVEEKLVHIRKFPQYGYQLVIKMSSE